MSKSLTAIQQRLPNVKPWVLIALVLGLLLTAYSLSTGVKYVGMSGQLASLREDVAQVSTSLNRIRAAKEPKGSGSLLEEVVQPVVGLRRLEDDQLMAILYETAQDNGVSISLLSWGERAKDENAEAAFVVQTITTTLQGSYEDVLQFISQLGEEFPGLQVADIGLSGLQGTSGAQARLQFYLAP